MKENTVNNLFGMANEKTFNLSEGVIRSFLTDQTNFLIDNEKAQLTKQELEAITKTAYNIKLNNNWIEIGYLKSKNSEELIRLTLCWINIKSQQIIFDDSSSGVLTHIIKYGTGVRTMLYHLDSTKGFKPYSYFMEIPNQIDTFTSTSAEELLQEFRKDKERVLQQYFNKIKQWILNHESIQETLPELREKVRKSTQTLFSQALNEKLITPSWIIATAINHPYSTYSDYSDTNFSNPSKENSLLMYHLDKEMYLNSFEEFLNTTSKEKLSDDTLRNISKMLIKEEIYEEIIKECQESYDLKLKNAISSAFQRGSDNNIKTIKLICLDETEHKCLPFLSEKGTFITTRNKNMPLKSVKCITHGKTELFNIQEFNKNFN